MSFSVDGWDPSYGASLELEGQLEESTARIDAEVELPADRWRPIDQDTTGRSPRRCCSSTACAASKRRSGSTTRPGHAYAVDPLPRTGQGDEAPKARPQRRCARPTRPAWCCCCAAGAHLVVAKWRHGLFSVAPHASDILTRAGGYKAHHVTVKRAGRPS